MSKYYWRALGRPKTRWGDKLMIKRLRKGWEKIQEKHIQEGRAVIRSHNLVEISLDDDDYGCAYVL
jgi:hypothetical protein